MLMYNIVVKAATSCYFYIFTIPVNSFEFLSIVASLSCLETHKIHNWLVNGLLEALHLFPL